MATPSLNLDLTDPRIQLIRDASEFAIYGDSGGVATDEEISRRYLDGFDQPRVSALVRDVLTGRWGLGTTTVAVADKLGTDHTAISRGLRWGDLSPKIEGRLMACRTRPADWIVPIDKVIDSRFRNAFICVADYLAARAPGSSRRDGDWLPELHTELMFQILELQQEDYAGFVLDDGLSRSIVRAVTDSATEREIIPFWYTQKRHQSAQRLIGRLESDSRFASEYLGMLLREWEGIFILASAATEENEWV